MLPARTREITRVEAGGAHLVSASVGALATGVALLTPAPYPVFSGFTDFLMWPAHWIYGVRTGRRCKALEQQTPTDAGASVSV